MSRLASRLIARDVVIILVAKIALIVLAGIFLFGKDHRVRVDAEIAARQILD